LSLKDRLLFFIKTIRDIVIIRVSKETFTKKTRFSQETLTKMLLRVIKLAMQREN